VIEQERESLDVYSQCTLLGGYSLLLIHMGQFAEAKRCINRRKAILKLMHSPILDFGTRLYEILLHLEQNQFDEAAQQIEAASAGKNTVSINQFFLRHLQLRLHLARNQLVAAEQTLDSLKTLTQQLQVSEGILDFRLEEIELKIRQRVLSKSLGEIARLEQTKDRFLLFRVKLLKSQALASQGQLEEALREIQGALALGEAGHYRPGLTWAFFHAAGIARLSQNDLQAKLYLQRGRRLAEELGLRDRESCFALMSEVMDDRDHARGSALMALAKYQNIGPELEYFLDTYQLVEGSKFTITDGERQSVVQEPGLRRAFFQAPGVFCFQREGVIISNLGEGKVRSVELSSSTALLPVFRLFLNAELARDGVSLSAVHESRSPHPYREHLHLPATKMLLSRLRDAIKVCGLGVQFDRLKGQYILVSSLPIYLIKHTDVAPTGTAPAERQDRETAVYERIAMAPFVATRDLCQEFAVTRQALHPLLKNLVLAKKIRMIRRGPVSGYISLGKK
jgi:tetratricopeptide (TPR) repeat protein